MIPVRNGSENEGQLSIDFHDFDGEVLKMSVKTMIQQEIVTEKGMRLFLRYGLISDDERGYGICISSETDDCYSEARGLSLNRKEIERLIIKLARGEVTPVALHDIVSDWICEKYTINI